MTEGRVTYYVAASVDGYIATEDGGVEWLEAFQEGTEMGDDVGAYEAFFNSVDCLVMGSRTYEQILTFGDWPYAEKPTFVLTSRDLPLTVDTVRLVDDDVASLTEHLTKEYGHVWLVGGGAVAQSFREAGQIDELRLSVIPVVLGSGIGLFGADGGQQMLRHAETTTRASGIVELQYEL